jgi:hypothetical protein
MTIINLGRIGDNINLLPVLYSKSLAGSRPTIVTSQKYSEIFDSITYCDVKRYSGDPIELQHAIGLCGGLPDLRLAQVFMNQDQRYLESSFAKESYRLGKFKDLWRKFPYIFDNRNPERELQLLDKVFQHIGDIQPFIAVAIHGVSSPFANREHLLSGIKKRFDDYRVVDLSTIRAERFQDLLGILDAASCLVTIDTAHLWLSNASKCPVVTLVNDGWRGSPPPVTSVASFRYRDYQIDQICNAIESALLPSGTIIGVVDRFGKEKRHREAAKSQEKAFDVWFGAQEIERTAQEIGDPRPLPMLKDMLGRAVMFGSDRDIVIWTNDDVKVLDPFAAVNHARIFGAVSIRRDPNHIGREMFAFRWDWLADRLRDFPDVAVACPWFDLAVAAWIRKQFGWNSTMQNLEWDLYPCEIPNDKIFIHPDHESSWLDKTEMPAATWNKRIFNDLMK